jgi:HSP20 family molecular chaperone IbpA
MIFASIKPMYYKSLFDTILNDLEFTNSNIQSDSVQSKGDVYLAKVIMPGIDKKNVSVKATDENLSVFVKNKDGKNYLLRKIRLGGLVDVNSIFSKLTNGILEVTMPKKEVKDSVDIKVS